MGKTLNKMVDSHCWLKYSVVGSVNNLVDNIEGQLIVPMCLFFFLQWTVDNLFEGAPHLNGSPGVKL